MQIWAESWRWRRRRPPRWRPPRRAGAPPGIYLTSIPPMHSLGCSQFAAMGKGPPLARQPPHPVAPQEAPEDRARCCGICGEDISSADEYMSGEPCLQPRSDHSRHAVPTQPLAEPAVLPC